MTSEIRIAFDPVADALDELGIEYRIGGSVASAALGVSRSTIDVDIVADITEAHAEPLAARLGAQHYVDAEEIRDAVRRGRSFNVIHLGTMVKVDVFVQGRRPYDRTAFTRKVLAGIGGEVERLFPVTAAEDIVLRKLEWYERGERSSERQWRDVLGVLKVQSGALDLAYMRRWAVELGLAELLDGALREAAG